MEKSYMSIAPKTLTSLARWHFVIATLFEGAKYLHQIGLFLILAPHQYGLLGTTFSIAYLCATLAGLEHGTALVPHLATITNNPNGAQYLNRSFLIPQLIQHSFASLAASYGILTITKIPSLSIAGGIIAFGEGIRCSLRPLVYAATKHHRSAQIEAVISYCYILSMWLLWIINPATLTVTLLTQAYAATSVLGVLYLGYRSKSAIISHYNQEAATHNQPSLPTRRELLATQLSLIVINLPHNLFSANFIVPFCAYHGGLKVAGALKITSEIAGAIKTILKSSIGFPLNAYAQTIQTIQARRSLLIWIAQATLPLRIVLGAAVFVAILAFIIPLPLYTKIVFLGFCLLIGADYLCMPYELMSIHTNTTIQIAGIRTTEVILDSLIMIIFFKWPLALLAGISLTRLVAWQVMAHKPERPALFFAALWCALKRITTQ